MTARSMLDRMGTLIGLILVAIVFGALIGSQFFAPANVELMARQAAIVCMAALGMTVVIATGGIDLSVGSIIALATVVIALMLAADQPPLLAALGAGKLASKAVNDALGKARSRYSETNESVRKSVEEARKNFEDLPSEISSLTGKLEPAELRKLLDEYT